jgi:hypothetical protein
MLILWVRTSQVTHFAGTLAKHAVHYGTLLRLALFCTPGVAGGVFILPSMSQLVQYHSSTPFWRWGSVLFMRLTFLVLLLCLGYVAPMGVSLACTMWCFYGLHCATVCACLYDTPMLASMLYL